MRFGPGVLQISRRQPLLVLIGDGAACRQSRRYETHWNSQIAAARRHPCPLKDVSTPRLSASLNLREGLMRLRLIGVAGCYFARDFGAFLEVTPNGEIGGRSAGAIALLERAVTPIKARDHLLVPLAGRRFGVDQRLRFHAPFLALVGAANAAQEMQRPEDLGKSLQVSIIGDWARWSWRRTLSLSRRLAGWLRPRLHLRLRLRRAHRRNQSLGARMPGGEAKGE